MDNLKKAQEINRIIMRKLHDVCKKYKITYFYDSGALIGAVRHQSFIPWDDDIDVAFTRKEYEKLLKVPKEEWGTDFELVSPKELVPDGFLDFVTRLLYMKDSVPLKSYEKAGSRCSEKYLDKIGVDCFILDNAYDNRLLQKLLLLRLTWIYGQAMGHRAYIDYSEYGGLQKAVIWFLSHLGKYRSIHKLIERYQKVSMAVKKESSHLYYSNYPMDEMYLWNPKEWYEGVVPLRVDDDFFDAPKGYHEILTALYGDYMQLPPKSARVPQHVITEEAADK